jgi:hypothetical protein
VQNTTPTTGIGAGVLNTPLPTSGVLRFTRRSPTCRTAKTISNSKLVVFARRSTPPDSAKTVANAKATQTATQGVRRTGCTRLSAAGSKPSHAMPNIKRDAMMRFNKPVLQIATSAIAEKVLPGKTTPAAFNTSSRGASE